MQSVCDAIRRRAYHMRKTMRETWHLVKHAARLHATKIWHKALTDTPCHYDSGRTTPTDTAYTLGMCIGPCRIGLSAVLWISIPATASMVAPKRTNERTNPFCSSTILISFLHLPRTIASSLFNSRTWQSLCTTSNHVLFGLPPGLEPTT